jgi:hypothetical protein
MKDLLEDTFRKVNLHYFLAFILLLLVVYSTAQTTDPVSVKDTLCIPLKDTLCTKIRDTLFTQRKDTIAVLVKDTIFFHSKDTLLNSIYNPLVFVPPPPRDTLKFYKAIKKIAYKHKATILLYHAIFVDPAPRKYEEKPLSDQQKVEDPNAKYVGKYIHNIYIQVYDPFGYSVNDTTRKITNPYQKLGNKYHVTTRHRIIQNLLLFRTDDTVDLLKFTESERILREARYVNDARIYIINAADSTDRVDVKIVVHDRWTVDAPISGGITGGHVTLRDRNLAGSGQVYEQYIGYTIPTNYYDYRGKYNIANIKHTYIASDVYYTTTRDATQTGFSFERPFFSALALWAGGIAGSKTWENYAYTDSTDAPPYQKKVPLAHIDYDSWVAFNYKPGTGKRKNRRVSNVVLALRYAGKRYQSRPSFLIDTNKVNANTSLYLGSVGFSLSKYYKDQYIFRFGANEDVPEGLRVQFLYGLLQQEGIGIRYYTGFDISRGKHVQDIGYLSANASFGSFYNKSVTNTGTLNLGLTYFSDLLRSHKWYYRQFIYFKYVYGINKPSTEKITLLSDELYGFDHGTLWGSSKMLLNLEGITYCPYNLVGFKIAPVALIGFGMLKTDYWKLWKSPVYQAYAIGVLIRNENLLTSSFEVTYGLYPNLPNENKHFYKFNPVVGFKLKVSGFDVPKPAIVDYQ